MQIYDNFLICAKYALHKIRDEKVTHENNVHFLHGNGVKKRTISKRVGNSDRFAKKNQNGNP